MRDGVPEPPLVYGGRPRVMDDKKIQMAKRLLSDPNTSINDVCETLKVSRQTLYRYVETNDH
ncbi:helix-turn-helix domain-containing protein [Alicyclobacillus suci]|uniref:helix-turn-helix domain-containing protein n=1 Tax=Alicyclobacillus suci TaxID=2816080 RepID=UPI001A8E4B1D|nr:helix-turn-helix domain-containing protein [Alicyclobacillus suci]